MKKLAFFLLAIVFNSISWAQQSENYILHAVPPPSGKVNVDGNLDDWDLSGQIEIFANYRTRATYSAKVAAMYDKEYFYLAIFWRDPTPLENMVDANFEIGSGWKSDCAQLRILTDVQVHADCWYSTAAQKPVVNIQYGAFRSAGPDSQGKLRPFPKPNAIDAGVKEAFSKGADGKSYIQEIALPWKLITAQSAIRKDTGEPLGAGRAYGAGQAFQMGMEFLWGGPDGRTFPIHRYADLVGQGVASREFFWESPGSWGTVKLEPRGNLKLPAPDFTEKLEDSLQKTTGPVKLDYTMPYDGFVTLVIEDERGNRVKNVIGMAARQKGPQTDFWDCTDEEGRLVPPGKYRFRGLLGPGIDPVYEATYGTAGIPPWDTGDGTGAWLADHTPPRAVAAGGDRVVMAAELGEAGYSLIGTDLAGRKKWGDRTFHGISRIAADDKYIYILESSWSVKIPTIGRMSVQTGKYAPFDTKPEPLLRVPVLKPGEVGNWLLQKGGEKGLCEGMAVGPDEIAMALGGDMSIVRFYDKKTGAIIRDVPVPKPGRIAYDKGGTLFVWSDMRLMKLVGGMLVPVIDNPDQKFPAALAIDGEGRFYLADGETNQVRVYGSDGKFVRAIGILGGRPRRGEWQPAGMLNPTSVAVDSEGKIWVTEMDSSPKRISVWDLDGKLVRDFIGPTGYGGTGANADPDDISRVFGSGCEFHLDTDNNKATVKAALGDVGGELMKANGHEYIMTKQGRLYMRDGDKLKLVAAMGAPLLQNLKKTAGDIPLPPAPPKTSGYSNLSFVWSDLNDDGVPQKEEVVAGSRWSGWDVLKYPVGVSGYFGSYWLDEDFNITSAALESYGASGGRGPFITKIPLKGWTRGGAPIWDISAQKMILDTKVTRVPGPFYVASKGISISGMNGVRDDGTVAWTYPDRWAGVHGSHNAPIPVRDDVLVGTLGCIGKAVTPVGTVFGFHSNMGRLYLMTVDGLFVGSIFQDTRLGSDPWPNEARKGAPLGGVTMGSEWFGGHMFQSTKTGDTYLIAGFTAYNLIKLDGLDKLQAIPAKAVEITGKELQAAEKAQQESAVKAVAKNTLLIMKAATPPSLDGRLTGFKKDGFVSWAAGTYRARAAVAVDSSNLYLGYEINGDTNPMVNGGKDVTKLFVTGDSVDLQLGTDPAANPNRGSAAPGDIRLLISVFNNEPVAVLYRWKSTDKSPVVFDSPWRSQSVDRVEVLRDAKIKITRTGSKYIVEASVPLADLRFKPKPGAEYKLDLGVIFSDAKGDNRAARVYWSNKATGLVADVPGEIMATPNLWGTATVAPH